MGAVDSPSGPLKELQQIMLVKHQAQGSSTGGALLSLISASRARLPSRVHNLADSRGQHWAAEEPFLLDLEALTIQHKDSGF